ncbi:hypothetical protein N1851_000005 [Merluccius polli]|uniref:Uncharacterized protein n=1 Tax=Merluccius polli TaxID=89951 RepID=A0AA47NDL1_MERPO|nr:hypothetical protein N1851_000005 [Merluccius polli]
MVLTSESTKQVVILELTVPWEDRIEEAHERKRAKYAELSSECRNNGWKAHCEPVEVGCQGFAGRSLLQTLKLLGVKGLQLKKATTNILEAAERASRWLWIRRGDPWSNMPLGHKPGTDHPWLGRPVAYRDAQQKCLIRYGIPTKNINSSSTALRQEALREILVDTTPLPDN